MTKPDRLFHATTPKMAARYRQVGRIIKPVRGFNCIEAAMAWAMKTGRTVIYEVTAPADLLHKLPDHHNQFGSAWWLDSDATEFRCVLSV